MTLHCMYYIYIYYRFVDGNIVMEHLEHSAMEEELNKLEYGKCHFYTKML